MVYQENLLLDFKNQLEIDDKRSLGFTIAVELKPLTFLL